MSQESPDRVSRFFKRLRSSRKISILIITCALITAVATFTGSLEDLFDLVRGVTDSERAKQKLVDSGIKYGELSFLERVALGDHEIVELFLTAGIRPDAMGSDGRTALHIAAEAGHPSTIRLLLEAKADPNTKLLDGKTPLMLAALNGHLESMSALLEHMGLAAVEAVDDDRYDTLLHATLARCVGCVELLIQKGINLGWHETRKTTALHIAAEKGFSEVVDLLVRSGMDLNIADKEGNIPIHLAASAGHKKCVDLLIKGGSKADILNHNKEWPLLLAGKGGHIETTVSLLSGGSVLKPEYPQDAEVASFLLHTYAKHPSDMSDLITRLVEYGFDPDVERNNKIPLLEAVLANRAPHVRALAKAGADVNRIRNEGTPYSTSILGRATQSASVDVVRALLESGAEVDGGGRQAVVKPMTWSGTSYGTAGTPLTWAARELNDEMVFLLLEHGANPNTQVPLKNKAIGTSVIAFAACPEDKSAVIEKLLNKGADVNALDNRGWSALMHAGKSGHIENIKTLLRLGADPKTISDTALSRGASALGVAFRGGQVGEHFWLILDAMDVPLGADDEDMTPLMNASRLGMVDVITRLVEKGADLDERCENFKYRYYTALMFAVGTGNADAVKLLLDKGAKTKFKDYLGNTALDIATEANNTEIFELIKKHGK